MNLSLLSKGLVLFSIILLVLAMLPVRNLIRDARQQLSWKVLGGFVVMFIVSYLLFLLHLLTSDHSYTELLVSAILFGGSCFVIIVIKISEQSVLYANQIAALERHHATHDQLTGLPNRKLLHDRMNNLIESSSDKQSRFCVLLMDLDRFKEINDTLGHYIGDKVLQKVAPKLVSAVRDHDTVARLGGDEFSILLPNTNAAEAEAFIHRLQENLKQHFIVEQNRLKINASIGIATYPEQGNDVDTLLQYADVAMYLAKQQGSGYAFYNPEQDIYSIKRLRLSQALEQAIHNNHIEFYYQPIIDLKNECVKGFEALARWQNSLGEFISPADFIPIAEQAGWIQFITRNALRACISQLAEWYKQNHSWTVAINLSLKDFNDPDLVSYISKLLEANQLPPYKLTIEVTESSAMTNLQQVDTLLKGLSELGVNIAVDDFGTGYSSLSHLKQMPVNTIKIDRSFISDMLEDENDAVIVRSTIDLAHNMGKSVVAEGVDSQDIVDILEILGCDYLQGFYFSRAIPAAEVEPWVQQFEIHRPAQREERRKSKAI